MSNIEIRPLRADEIERFAQLSSYAFEGRSVEQRASDLSRRFAPERNVLVAVDGNEIISQVLIYEFGVWIDAVRYPTGGLANVATAPERARQGYAARTLRASLAWMRDELGQCLSTLYPTVYPLYAGLGWALADDSQSYIGVPAAFRPSPQLPADPGGRVERRLARPDDVELLEPVYRRFAQPRSGYLDRPRWYWEDFVLRRGRTGESAWLALWYGSDQQLGGYALYGMVHAPQPRLQVIEIITLRPEGYHGLLTFLAGHHLWEKIHLDGGGDVAWRSLVVNPHHLEIEVTSRRHFMLRVVDVARAVGRRAVGRRPERDIVVQIRDEAAPWNDGEWQIGVREENGARCWRCEPAPGRTPVASMDIATFSSLFAGFLTVPQAIDLGYLRVDSEAATTLTALFHTTYPPHSRDHF